MFRYFKENKQEMIPITLDGQSVSLPCGMTVAAALLSVGEMISRISPSSHKPCSPHCLMGVCYECLMEINGIKRQACLTKIEEGMVINRHLDSDDTHNPSGSIQAEENSHDPSC